MKWGRLVVLPTAVGVPLSLFGAVYNARDGYVFGTCAWLAYVAIFSAFSVWIWRAV